MKSSWMLLAGLLSAAGLAAPLAVVSARCEDLKDPVGIANAAPRFIWAYDWADAKQVPSARPSGAELRLASSRENLVAGQDLLWTKRTSPSDIFSCAYDGPALAPDTPYWWQVRLVLADGGSATDWSAPARFSVGL